jgi:hypothetical protein
MKIDIRFKYLEVVVRSSTHICFDHNDNIQLTHF